MKITNMDELLKHELRDLYSAETQIAEMIPKLVQLATSEKLIDALEEHLLETKMHIERLDTVNEVITFKIGKHLCKGIRALASEIEKSLFEVLDPHVRNVAIACFAQKIEHYEIAGYGCAAEFAFQLDYGKEAAQLVQTLDEEKSAESLISSLAKGGLFTKGLNQKAIDKNR